MLRVIQNQDARSAKGYYTSKAEYYAGGRQELPGRWGGEGAALLGLSGEADKRSFDRLCDNRHPLTNQQLTVRQKKNRTPGYDFNFHACKSSSILYGLTGDIAILAAFRAAVDETMRQIEAEMKTRVRKGKRSEDRTIGNAIWAEHTHLTARPVGGLIDPHLHSHCFVFNAVFDPVEGRWKAGQFRDLKREAPRYQKAFHARFAAKLFELGYPIERQGDAWEIAGLRALIDKFSRRRDQVEAYAESHGITSARLKDTLGAKTRERKQNDATMEELRREWASRLSGRDHAALAVVTAMRPFIGNSSDRQALDALLSGVSVRHVEETTLPPGWAERQSPANRQQALTLHRRQQHQAEAEAAHAAYRSIPPPRHNPHVR